MFRLSLFFLAALAIFGSKAPGESKLAATGLRNQRVQVKLRILEYLDAHIDKKLPKALASALITGENHNSHLKSLFRRLGLSHLLVISGMHFVLLTSLCTRLFRLRSWILLFFLTIYLIFLGASPSVTRAYIAIVIYLIGKQVDLRLRPVDIWGFSLMLSLLCDTQLLYHLGFQLSYAATLAILLLYRPIESIFSRFWPSMTPPNSRLDKLYFFTLAIFKPLISLTCAVHLFILPLIAVHFHTLTLIGILYNLFAAPLFMVIFSLLLVLLPVAPLLPLWGMIAHYYLVMLSKYPLVLSRTIELNFIGEVSVCVCCCFLVFLILLDSKRQARLKSSLNLWRS